jgi:hypothetical protein
VTIDSLFARKSSAHMKRILKLDRLRPRGLSGVRDEVLLTATAQGYGKRSMPNSSQTQKLECAEPKIVAVITIHDARAGFEESKSPAPRRRPS